MNKDEQMKKHFETGKALRQQFRYKAASAEFQKASEIAPASADLLVEWGQALSGKRDFAGAIEKYQKASELDPMRSDVYVLWGDALCDLKKYEESKKQYAKAISIEPRNIDAHFGWAKALYAQEQWKEAVEAFRKVIDYDPTRDVYFQLITALGKLGPDEKAKIVKDLEATLTSDARYAIGLTYWGNALAFEKKYDEAIERYRKASTLDPALVEAYVGLGGALLQQNKYRSALNAYFEAIERNPHRIPDVFYLIDDVIVNLNQEESAAATKRLDETLRRDAKNARLYCQWGDFLAGKMDYSEAIERYETALLLDPGLLDAFLGWGDALAAQKKYDEAIEQYRQATLIAPASGSACRKWAVALLSQKQNAKAAEQYRRAILNDLASVSFRELIEILASADSETKTQTYLALETALAHTANSEHYIAWGEALSEKERYSDAITQYEKALRLNETATDAWNGLGKAWDGLGDYSKAIDSYRRTIELDPYNDRAYLLWTNALFKQRRFPESTEICRQAVEFIDDPTAHHNNWGLALMNQRKYDGAIEQYKKAVEVNPNDGFACNAWGWTLYVQQKYDEAIKQYQQAVEKQPWNAPAHHNWGVALFAQRKYDEAIEHYHKALDLDPRNPNPYLDWGNALDEQGRRAEAIKKCEEAIEIKEDFAYAYHNIAYYLWAQGDYRSGRMAWERASKAYERTQQHEKKNANADFFQYYAAVLYDHLWNPNKSEWMLKEGLAIDSHHTVILKNLVELYLDRHNEPCNGTEADANRPLAYGKAREYFVQAERILKERLDLYEDSWTLQELGDLYLKMGEYDDAKRYFEKTLGKDPGSPAPCVALGVVHSRTEDFRQAAQYFERAHRRDRNNLNVWSNLAEVYLKLNPKEPKQVEKAEVEFRNILKIAPDHIDSKIGLGEVYTAMAEAGEKDFYEVAIEQYSQAIQLADNGQGSKHLKTRELAAVLYSRGYARVKLYEASRPFGDESLLSDALQDFQRCAALDREHYKAERAKNKLDKRLSRSSRQWFAERVAPWLVLVPSLFVLFVTQLSFIFGVPDLKKPIDLASYIALTFGSLIFLVVGLFLPEIQKLKGAGIEVEKSPVTQISTSGSIGINK